MHTRTEDSYPMHTTKIPILTSWSNVIIICATLLAKALMLLYKCIMFIYVLVTLMLPYNNNHVVNGYFQIMFICVLVTLMLLYNNQV